MSQQRPTPHLEDVERIGPEDHGHHQEPHRPRLVARGTVQDVSGEKGRGGEGEERGGEGRGGEGKGEGWGGEGKGEGRGGGGEGREKEGAGRGGEGKRRGGGAVNGEVEELARNVGGRCTHTHTHTHTHTQTAISTHYWCISRGDRTYGQQHSHS